MGWRGYLGLVLLLLVLVFIVQNAAVVTVKFLFWDFTVSRALMVFFVLAAGIGVGLALPSLLRRRHPGHKHDF
jgi:putative membrane protein